VLKVHNVGGAPGLLVAEVDENIIVGGGVQEAGALLGGLLHPLLRGGLARGAHHQEAHLVCAAAAVWKTGRIGSSHAVVASLRLRSFHLEFADLELHDAAGEEAEGLDGEDAARIAIELGFVDEPRRQRRQQRQQAQPRHG